MKVAIQGNDNSFHSIAAKNLYGTNVEFVFCETFKDVFSALSVGKAEKAVVAVENSLYGSINDVYDLLIQHNFWITAEVYEQINFFLFGTSDSSLGTITDVYSQSFALGETSNYFENTLPSAKLHEYFDTAAAAEMIHKSADKTKASVSSKPAGDKLGLKVLAKNIETHHHNYTRFIALSPQKINCSRATKTSITFRTSDTPGSLYKALGVFAKQNVNLTKLESRPIIGEAWVYMYYVDFELGINEPKAIQAMEELKNYATDIKILGSYKAGDTLLA